MFEKQLLPSLQVALNMVAPGQVQVVLPSCRVSSQRQEKHEDDDRHVVFVTFEKTG